MITIEQLMATSFKRRLADGMARAQSQGYDWGARRHPDTVFGTVMSSAEVDAALARNDPDLLISNSVTCISNGEVFFLTDDHVFGHGVLPRSFLSCSISMPHRAAPRPAVPDGWVRTAAALIAVYCEGERQISRVEDLVAYVNACDRETTAA